MYVLLVSAVDSGRGFGNPPDELGGMSFTKRSGKPSGVTRLTGPATRPNPWV
jgi:hypothetical protein